MTAIRNTIAAALFGFAGLIATAARANDDVSTFDVEANSTLTLDMTLCGPSVDVDIAGDTDLDFYLYDSTGALIWVDDDLTDWTSLTVEMPAEQCNEYDLEVINYGNIYNRFRVILDGV